MNYPLYNNTLCPAVWDQTGEDYQLKDDVRKALLAIAEDFIEKNVTENDLSLTIKDVILIGSITNFNWTPYSDFDMHIIVDFAELDMSPEDAKVLVDGLKSSWNKEHAITIKGHPVELYIQDITEKAVSMSSYSVKNGEWIKKPTKQKPTFDKEFIKRKHSQIKSKLDDMLKNPSEEKLEEMLERIYDMRQAGLDKKGEFSEENIVFKILRSQGYLDRIRDAVRKVYDAERSLDEVEKLDDGIGVANDHLTWIDDEADDLVPVDDESSNRMRRILINGVWVKVFAAYIISPTRAKKAAAEWDDPAEFAKYLKDIRHRIKYPSDASDKKFVDEWISMSIRRFQKHVPEIKDADIIIPLGSKSSMNLQISDELLSIAPKATVLNQFINKLTWKDVELSQKWYRERDLPNPNGKPKPWISGALNMLKSKKANYPNEPFEVKKVPQSWRRYFMSFYRANDPKSLTGKTIVLIDDTLEEGATLKEALRSISEAKPEKILVYIFLWGRGT